MYTVTLNFFNSESVFDVHYMFHKFININILLLYILIPFTVNLATTSHSIQLACMAQAHVQERGWPWKPNEESLVNLD